MINLIKKIKKTFLYEIFISYLFYPFYHFLWKNIINLKARLLFIFLKDKNEYFSLGKNDKILIKNNPDFENLASEIKDESLKKIPDLKKKLLSEDYKSKILSKNKAFGELPYSIDFYDDLSESLKSKIVKFAASKKETFVSYKSTPSTDHDIAAFFNRPVCISAPSQNEFTNMNQVPGGIHFIKIKYSILEGDADFREISNLKVINENILGTGTWTFNATN